MISTANEATRAVAVSEALVRSRAAELVSKGGDARVGVKRAQPRWHGGTKKVDGQSLKVVEGSSQHAIIVANAAQAQHE